MAVMPSDQISTLVSYPVAPPERPSVSGAIQCGVPIMVPRFDMVGQLDPTFRSKQYVCALDVAVDGLALNVHIVERTEHRLADGGDARLGVAVAHLAHHVQQRAAVAKLHHHPQGRPHLVLAHEGVLVRHDVVALALAQDTDLALDCVGRVVLERQHLDRHLLLVALPHVDGAARARP
eukprot:scaffold12486_cov112-Isochrysis_galbana.AAC.3